MSRFDVRRADGRSNGQVIIDLLVAAEPGTIFTYQQLADALNAGTDTHYDRRAIQSVIAGSLNRIAKELRRTLQVVPTVGYRVALAAEHRVVAMTRKRRSDNQLVKAVTALEFVRLDEMDENNRNAHMLSHMAIKTLFMQQVALSKRQDEMERVIAQMRNQQTTDKS